MRQGDWDTGRLGDWKTRSSSDDWNTRRLETRRLVILGD